MARPRKELSDADFELMAKLVSIQCTQDEICGIIGMNTDTLNTRLKERGEGGFSDFYKKHSDKGKASLRRLQWRAAEEGNPTMLVWLGKQMLKQRDKPEDDSKTAQEFAREIVEATSAMKKLESDDST